MEVDGDEPPKSKQVLFLESLRIPPETAASHADSLRRLGEGSDPFVGDANLAEDINDKWRKLLKSDESTVKAACNNAGEALRESKTFNAVSVTTWGCPSDINMVTNRNGKLYIQGKEVTEEDLEKLRNQGGATGSILFGGHSHANGEVCTTAVQNAYFMAEVLMK